MKRRRWTKKQRAEIFMDHGGRCYLCNEKIGVDEIYDLDHEIALDLGGKDEAENLRPAHQDCHRGKTKADIKLIAKGRRIRRNLDPETRRKPKKAIPKPANFKWPSRGFPKRVAKDH